MAINASLSLGGTQKRFLPSHSYHNSHITAVTDQPVVCSCRLGAGSRAPLPPSLRPLRALSRAGLPSAVVAAASARRLPVAPSVPTQPGVTDRRLGAPRASAAAAQTCTRPPRAAANTGDTPRRRAVAARRHLLSLERRVKSPTGQRRVGEV